MPYNTRRKSLSLPSLGIHVPVTHAARAAAAQRISAANLNSPQQPQRERASSATHPPPTPLSPESHQSKKVKRSHGDDPVSLPNASALLSPRSAARKLPAVPVKLETTPPPSPTAEQPSTVEDEMDTSSDTSVSRKIDYASINDTIVEAVIARLEAETNRPHLVKELAAILIQQLQIVQQ
jgi:hypothetical protein